MMAAPSGNTCGGAFSAAWRCTSEERSELRRGATAASGDPRRLVASARADAGAAGSGAAGSGMSGSGTSWVGWVGSISSSLSARRRLGRMGRQVNKGKSHLEILRHGAKR